MWIRDLKAPSIVQTRFVVEKSRPLRSLPPRHAVEKNYQAAAPVLNGILTWPLGRQVHVAALKRFALEMRGYEIPLRIPRFLKTPGCPRIGFRNFGFKDKNRRS